MKVRVYFFIAAVIFSSSLVFAQKSNEDVLLTIGDNEITKKEFVRIYKKNNKNTIDQKSLEEYLDLFINFKLKVIEAELLGMDTLKSFQKELNGYRKQLTKKYFTNKEYEEKLIRESFERSKTAVQVNHVFIKLDEYASPQDTTAAYNKALEARNRLLDGEAFENVAMAMSEDPNVKYNAGNLGFFSSFKMPYNFENIAYNQEIGEISMPVRTRNGYHIIKTTKKSPVPLRYKVAHIAVRAPYNSGPEIIEKAKKWIEALADSIEQGSTFEHIAKVYSEDKQSAVLGGELPWSNPGQFVPEFEDVCFNLEKKGDISEPVKTYFGWHLIKLIDTEDHGSFEDHREDFEKKVKRDPDRQKAIDQSIVNKIYAKYDIAEHHENVKPFVNLVDSLTFSGIWIKKKGENMNEPIITIEETNYTQKDFNEFLTKYARRQKIIPKEAYINQYFERFKKQMLFEFENRKLAEKDEDFRNLMQEYHDGILLFELTDQMVWSKAVKDTAGLKAFHEKNKKNYMWEKRIEAEIYTCKSENLAKKAMKLASKKTKKGYDNGFIINKICKDDSTNTCIKIVSSTYEKDDNEIIAEVEWKEGISELINIDDKFVFVNIKKIREPEPKTLYEARGLITADYQNYLEEEWIKELRGKYTIEVNKELLSSIE